MPNWSDNILEVTYSNDKGKQELEELHKKIYVESSTNPGTHQFDFNGTVPMPEEYNHTNSPPQNDEEKALSEKLLKKYGSRDWYDWRSSNWGTKWNADLVLAEEIENGMRYRLHTAWCPPEMWMIKTSRMYPNLNFEMYFLVEGSDEPGLIIFNNGESSYKTVDLFEFLNKFNVTFRFEHSLLTGDDYDKMKEYFLNRGELVNVILEPLLIKKLKDKDLPLFMKFEWWGYGEDFWKRFKGAKTCI